MFEDNLNNLTDEQKDLCARILNLILRRVLNQVYSGLTVVDRKNMEDALTSSDNKTKEGFIKKYIPDFEEKFRQEAEKIEKEIKAEIQKQL